jgi:UTP--glucose-1-phosphate uridylyltransferase
MKKEKIYSYDIDAKRYDVGNKLDYVEAILDFGLQKEDLKEGLKALIKEKAKDL